MLSGEGKQYEADIEQSCKDQSIFYFRVRDVNPMAIKPKFKLPQNKYDCLMFYKNHLFPVEMKSTKEKNISLKESMIKANQIKSLHEAAGFDGVIPGFLFNFRLEQNRSFFIHISDFLQYQHIAENQIKEHAYKNRVNKSSIPIGICEEIGVEVSGIKKVKNMRWYLNKLCTQLIEIHRTKME